MFHKKIKNERTKRNLSQQDLANKLNISRQTISKWERQERYPSIDTLIDLSDFFEVSLDELLKNDLNLKEKIIKDSKKLKYPKLKMFFDVLHVIGIIAFVIAIPIVVFNSISGVILGINAIIVFLIGLIGKYFVDKKYVS